jgi:hypothetical protein
LQAKTFTKKMLTLLFCTQKALPKNAVKRLMPLKIAQRVQHRKKLNP